MIEIRMKGENLDLPGGFSVSIEDSSPVFNDRGSQSVPTTVPATGRNIRLLGAPHRIDSAHNPNNPEQTVEFVDGAYIRRGTLNLTEAGRSAGFTFNIGFDNSTAYAKWSKKKLSELSNLPVFQPQLHEEGYFLDDILEDLYRVYRFADPQTDDFAVFPVAVNNESTGSDDGTVYWEVLNVPGSNGLSQPTTVKRVIDGEVTEVTVPEGYMVTPFLRVWRIIELIFRDLGVDIVSNPFKEDPELSLLVVLNNAADAICAGRMKYSDLMPDSTVEEFLNALWVRFGLVYNLDLRKGTVTLRFLKDILSDGTAGRLEEMITAPELIRYETPQYIRLSAGTSIEGAAPSHDRFEDFVKGLDVSKVRMGSNVHLWTNNGTADEPDWSGDQTDGMWENYDPWNDPDWPDPELPDPDDRDDDRDYDQERSVRSAAPTVRSSSGSSDEAFLAREYVTGMWSRLDAVNSAVRITSSSFFSWDPRTEGMTALELTSDDEFVPVARVRNAGLGTGNAINDNCPLYLFGARHYHSYIKGSEETDKGGDETPLAFLFAYTSGGKTVGRFSPEKYDGTRFVLDNGLSPTLSLLFQFKDGLFARYWAAYDEILRHGNRSVEVSARVNKLELQRLDFMKPYTFRGIRCLIDTLDYSLPSGREVPTDMTLRTIQTQGNYDIVREQNIPEFSTAVRHVEWFLYSDAFGTRLDTQAVRMKAVAKFKEESGYLPHGVPGDYYYVTHDGARFRKIERKVPTWEADSSITAPPKPGLQLVRIYKALLTYDIHEFRDFAIENDEEDRYLTETPVGEVTVEVDYAVVLYSNWVSD